MPVTATQIKFITPHENTIKKHGRFTCVWCRKLGIKRDGDICTYRKSISWKKDTCSCDEHRGDAIKLIESYVLQDSEDYTEADYQTWMRL